MHTVVFTHANTRVHSRACACVYIHAQCTHMHAHARARTCCSGWSLQRHTTGPTHAQQTLASTYQHTWVGVAKLQRAMAQMCAANAHGHDLWRHVHRHRGAAPRHDRIVAQTRGGWAPVVRGTKAQGHGFHASNDRYSADVGSSLATDVHSVYHPRVCVDAWLVYTYSWTLALPNGAWEGFAAAVCGAWTWDF